jgi:hypothetical protein
MAENLSNIVGIPALLPVAAIFYVAALLWPIGGLESPAAHESG